MAGRKHFKERQLARRERAHARLGQQLLKVAAKDANSPKAQRILAELKTLETRIKAAGGNL